MDVEKARFNMVEQQIRPAEVLDARVLALITKLPREDFVLDEYRDLAFSDAHIPLGEGEVMLKPLMEARMLQALAIKETDKILEIGTGSGYSTALLASLGSHVFSVEINKKFSETAHQRLTAQGFSNVTLVVGDAANGWNANGPYDVIAVTGGMPILPPNIKQSLSEAGRVFVVTGESPAMQAMLITRVGDTWVEKVLFETDFPVLRNVERPSRFVF